MCSSWRPVGGRLQHCRGNCRVFSQQGSIPGATLACWGNIRDDPGIGSTSSKECMKHYRRVDFIVSVAKTPDVSDKFQTVILAQERELVRLRRLEAEQNKQQQISARWRLESKKMAEQCFVKEEVQNTRIHT